MQMPILVQNENSSAYSTNCLNIAAYN